MKTLVIPDKLPSYLAKAIDEAVPMAYGFLCAKYGWKFDDVVLLIQPNGRRCFYFDNEKKPHAKFGHTPVAAIAIKSPKLLLYEKNSIGKYKQGVNIGYTLNIACGIIHELTHHIQFKRGRKEGNKGISYSELETTANELEFLKVSSPEWYKLIIITEK